jgi:hypothetical protein
MAIYACTAKVDMTQNKIIEMAREAGFLEHEDQFYTNHEYGDCKLELEAFAKLVAAKEREAIQDEYWICVNSDLENGVKSLNEKAAERFTTYFPELSKFGSWLKARGEA